jgi:hypothetical protein
MESRWKETFARGSIDIYISFNRKVKTENRKRYQTHPTITGAALPIYAPSAALP